MHANKRAVTCPYCTTPMAPIKAIRWLHENCANDPQADAIAALIASEDANNWRESSDRYQGELLKANGEIASLRAENARLRALKKDGDRWAAVADKQLERIADLEAAAESNRLMALQNADRALERDKKQGKRIAELEAALRKRKDEAEHWCALAVSRLGALRQYGRHDEDCAAQSTAPDAECICGLDAALGGEK